MKASRLGFMLRPRPAFRLARCAAARPAAALCGMALLGALSGCGTAAPPKAPPEEAAAREAAMAPEGAVAPVAATSPAERGAAPAAPPGLTREDLTLPLQPYKLNYVLPYALDFRDHDGRQEKELKFQLSLKKQIVAGWPLFLGYTQKSFWQVYDRKESRPFRETNYNPELFVDLLRPVPALSALDVQIGAEHESNGQSVGLTRSWNRVYLWPRYRFESVSAAFKYWYRLPEEKQEKGQPPADENPNIEHFLGRFELYLTWNPAEAHQFRLMARKGNADPDGTYELDYLFTLGDPRSGRFLMLQYFRGYGESLIDYDQRVNKVGVGIAFQ